MGLGFGIDGPSFAVFVGFLSRLAGDREYMKNTQLILILHPGLLMSISVYPGIMISIFNFRTWNV